MENASKALIIAGAILISILLISVGIIIMNAINNPVQQSVSSADAQAVQTFNAEFIQYDGQVQGSTLRGLLSAINAHNSTDADNQITINNVAVPANGYTTAAFNIAGAGAGGAGGHNFTANHTYTVTMEYGGEGGRIDNVQVAW